MISSQVDNLVLESWIMQIKEVLPMLPMQASKAKPLLKTLPTAVIVIEIIRISLMPRAFH